MGLIRGGGGSGRGRELMIRYLGTVAGTPYSG